MNNWQKIKLEEIAKLFAGGTPSTRKLEYWGGTIRWMSSGEVNLKRIDEVDKRITKLGFNNSSAKIVPSNSILIALAGQGKTRGTVAINKIELTTNQSLAAIVPDEKYLYYEYLYYNLDNRYEELRQISVGSGRAGLNLKILKNLKVEVPPKAEQKKIAEILSTWDKATETCEKLISAKQTCKRALMQRLLTGKKRFPKFAEQEWKDLRIGNIAQGVSQKNVSDENITVLSCTKHQGLVDSLSYFGKKIFSKDLSKYKVVERGQFAYATNHIEEGSIGYQDLYDKALISPMYTVFETSEKVDDRFLFNLLKTETYRHIFEAMTSGSINRRGSLRWSEFKRIKVKLPSIEEQKQIAEVLNSCDKEIELLEKQCEALKQQKRGLMQKLLTGKIRVKIENI